MSFALIEMKLLPLGNAAMLCPFYGINSSSLIVVYPHGCETPFFSLEAPRKLNKGWRLKGETGEDVPFAFSKVRSSFLVGLGGGTSIKKGNFQELPKLVLASGW